MSEKGIKIDVFRRKTLEEFTSLLSDPDSRLDIGSSSAAAGALSAAFLVRASRMIASEKENPSDLEWYERNTEILRTYMLNLIDEDVKCRGPLRRAMKEGDDRKIEAARQASVSISLEIINMMGKGLEMAENLLSLSDLSSAVYLSESAELAYAASVAAGKFILWMSSQSPDDTYRYVVKRENELTMLQQKEALDRIRTELQKRGI